MKQQQLTFDKGITNVPSDAVCADNTLEESLGMVYEHSEHRVIQKPKDVMTINNPEETSITNAYQRKVFYVHHLNDTKRYIVGFKQETDSVWALFHTEDGTSDGYTKLMDSSQNQFTTSGDATITSIGKTLIISDGTGLHYFLWNATTYKNIKYPIPNVGLEAKLCDESDGQDNTGRFATSSLQTDGIFEMDDNGNITINSGKREDFNNLVVGLYSKNLKQVAQSKCFSKPFFVRAALEMYDGTYTNITTPILLIPSISQSTKFYLYGGLTDAVKGVICATQMLQLYIRQTTSFDDYSDIIKDVVVFVSRGIDTYDTSHDQNPVSEHDDVVGYNISSLFVGTGGNLTASVQREDTFIPPSNMDIYGIKPWRMRGLNLRGTDSVNSDIETTSVFYKIASLGRGAINSYIDIETHTTSEVIENLETQETLKNDDYFSHSGLVARYLYSYNNRLNLANVSRSFYSGYGFFMPLDDTANSYEYVFDVTIKQEDGTEVTVRHAEMYTTQKQGIYFYYPDSRANHVKIYKIPWGGQCKIILDADLKEHPFLNGAYYFAGMSSITVEPSGTDTTLPTVPTPSPEVLPNYIITSEVNNPWVFLASGYNKVGTGKILAMSTITQALSEGQFGQYPLLVFSESGIWAMATDNTGLFRSIHPLSREVSLDPPCIVQTDGAVFFTSEKGLMVVVGNQVKCVSEQLSGKSSDVFVNYLRTAFIAYDYRDSLLWIFKKPEQDDQRRTCWIYGIKSSTFAHYDFGVRTVNDGGATAYVDNIITNVVNDYPDTLLQCDDNKLYTLLNRNNINEDVVGHTETDPDTQQEVTVYEPIRYKATLMSRPMKLEDALALKTIMQVRNITDFNVDAHIKLVIKASNNLRNWVQLGSLRGMPWKYYKFKYEFENLLATDRFAGSVIVTEERRSNKLR